MCIALIILFIYLFIYLCFLGPHLRHMEVPRLGAESELQLPAYTAAHGHAGSLTHWPRPGIKPETSRFLVGFVNCWAPTGTPITTIFKPFRHLKRQPSRTSLLVQGVRDSSVVVSVAQVQSVAQERPHAGRKQKQEQKSKPWAREPSLLSRHSWSCHSPPSSKPH